MFLIGIRATVKFAVFFSSVCERSGSHTVTHRITAVTAEGYRTSPRAKKLLWHIYACAPVTATALVYLRARRQEHGPQLR